MFPKKKKGLDVAIMVKPSSKKSDDLESPDPVEEVGKMKPTPEHEAAETPEYEAQEEYGAKIVKDIETAGAEHGLDAEKSHAVAASFFRAVADCLSGEEKGESSDQPEDLEAAG